MKRSVLVFITVHLASRGGVATAHPGHGTDGGSHGLLHYLSEPVHAAGLLAAAAGLAATLCYFRGRRSDPARTGSPP
ncbi:MAG: hypothetical protein GTO03_03615 [Planctomycetales bacterium]|nr:hypothetical protein [Planctomycetales bacterium]